MRPARHHADTRDSQRTLSRGNCELRFLRRCAQHLRRGHAQRRRARAPTERREVQAGRELGYPGRQPDLGRSRMPRNLHHRRDVVERRRRRRRPATDLRIIQQSQNRMPREHWRPSQDDAPMEQRPMHPGHQLGLQQPNGVGGSRLPRRFPVRELARESDRATLRGGSAPGVAS
jgi:hypothetical protein